MIDKSRRKALEILKSIVIIISYNDGITGKRREK